MNVILHINKKRRNMILAFELMHPAAMACWWQSWGFASAVLSSFSDWVGLGGAGVGLGGSRFQRSSTAHPSPVKEAGRGMWWWWWREPQIPLGLPPLQLALTRNKEIQII